MFYVFTDFNIDSPPSLKPNKKYSDISGLPVRNYFAVIFIVSIYMHTQNLWVIYEVHTECSFYRQTTQTLKQSYASLPQRSSPTSGFSPLMLSLATLRLERQPASYPDRSSRLDIWKESKTELNSFQCRRLSGQPGHSENKLPTERIAAGAHTVACFSLRRYWVVMVTV